VVDDVGGLLSSTPEVGAHSLRPGTYGDTHAAAITVRSAGASCPISKSPGKVTRTSQSRARGYWAQLKIVRW
jgi:hypothetical protein